MFLLHKASIFTRAIKSIKSIRIIRVIAEICIRNIKKFHQGVISFHPFYFCLFDCGKIFITNQISYKYWLLYQYLFIKIEFLIVILLRLLLFLLLWSYEAVELKSSIVASLLIPIAHSTFLCAPIHNKKYSAQIKTEHSEYSRM